MSYLVKDIIEEQMKTGIPYLYIFGAGGLARMIYAKFKSMGKEVNAFVVDDRYYSSPSEKETGLPIIRISQLAGRTDYRLIIGMEGDYLSSINSAGLNPDNVLAADFLGYFATSEQNEFFEAYYEEHKTEFDDLRNMLCDDASRKSFDDYIEQKRTGIYGKEFDRVPQYFDSELLGDKLSDREVFIDCGAFQGETALAFIDFLNENGKTGYHSIYEIEPDSNNVRVLEDNLKGLKNIHIVKAGVSNIGGKVSFDENGSSSRINEGGSTQIDVISIDEFIDDDTPVSFIKMDIEGAELSALEGAVNTIKKNRPKLAICVYHKNEDLIEIPRFIRSLQMDYKYYLRSYSRCGVETVLYAV